MGGLLPHARCKRLTSMGQKAHSIDTNTLAKIMFLIMSKLITLANIVLFSAYFDK